MNNKYDYVIIGCGIIGLSIARQLKVSFPQSRILVIDKESEEAFHASGRNSGVLHAGFYYSADSFKAKFTVEGNKALKDYCLKKQIPINTCGKLVVAQNEEEREMLHELLRRGMANGSNVKVISADEAKDIEPNVKTHQEALYSPDTATINPKSVCQSLKRDLEDEGVVFHFNTAFVKYINDHVITNQESFQTKKLINCAGLYADKIAHALGFGQSFTLIPFKGLYLKYTKNKTDVRTNIYPVPNLKNPFLGVHFTKTVDDDIKIGPTAIPAFWRENYQGFDKFHLGELLDVLGHEARLMVRLPEFRFLAMEEIRKYNKQYFIRLAQNMVQSIDPAGFTEFTKPGIRAQLIDIKKNTLVQDFVVEADERSIHVLNAVSPAYTCAFPFAKYVCDQYIK